MMKKLLVLMLVLGMGSLASAAYMWGQDAPGPAADLLGDGDFGAYFIAAYDGPIAWDLKYGGSLAAITDMTAEMADFLPGATVVLFAEFADAVDPANNRPNGPVVGISKSVPQDVLVNLLNADNLSVMQSVLLTPEPMSLMLLGLGGLFLRRRK
jgi:hypothetical protein